MVEFFKQYIGLFIGCWQIDLLGLIFGIVVWLLVWNIKLKRVLKVQGDDVLFRGVVYADCGKLKRKSRKDGFSQND